MATSKTGSFWLTEEVQVTAVGTNATGTIDLGAYVDVGDQQAVAIEQVDFILQAFDTATGNYSYSFAGASTGDVSIGTQLSALNPGNAVLSADDNSLIASGVILFDGSNNATSIGPDLYPDNFGKLSESRMVVNDQLYLLTATAGSALTANWEWRITARIKARIVKLSTKDWMAIAIQSTAADN